MFSKLLIWAQLMQCLTNLALVTDHIKDEYLQLFKQQILGDKNKTTIGWQMIDCLDPTFLYGFKLIKLVLLLQFSVLIDQAKIIGEIRQKII